MTQKAFSLKGLTIIHSRISSGNGNITFERSSIDTSEEHKRETEEGPQIKNTIRPQVQDESQKAISIIMADDDCDDRELFQEAVEANIKNIKLEMAVDGRSLMEMLNEKARLPDLIFLDLNMPYKSGMECLVELRKSERLKNIPVLIYSTSSSQKDIDDTYHNGANLYIKKPSNFRELENIISRVLALDWDVYRPKGDRQLFFYTSKK
jgi:PleD family two-component response regulator